LELSGVFGRAGGNMKNDFIFTETKTILIADDREESRKLIASHLETTGYKTIQTDSGRKALEIFQSRKIDLVICDIKTPITTGPKTSSFLEGFSVNELLEGIKRLSPDTPVIFVTSYIPTPAQKLEMKDKADAYLEKPISLHSLTRTVKTLIDSPFSSREERDDEDLRSPERLSRQKMQPIAESEEQKFDFDRYLQVLRLHRWKFAAILGLSLLFALFLGLKIGRDFYEVTFEIFFLRADNPYAQEADLPMVSTGFNTNFWLSVMNSDEVARLTEINSGYYFPEGSVQKMIKSKATDRRDISNPVFEVTLKARDNVMIPHLSRAYVSALNDYIVNYQIDSSEKLITYLINQIAAQNDQLAEIDRVLISEQGSNPYLASDFSKLSTDLETYRKNLTAAQIELSSIRASRRHTEAELARLDAPLPTEAVFSEQLRERLVQLNDELNRALTDKQEAHPEVIAIRNNIARINRMLSEELEENIGQSTLLRNTSSRQQLMSRYVDLQVSELSLATRVQSLQKVINELEGQMFPDDTDARQQQLVRNRELILMKIKMLNARLLDVQSSAQANLSRFVTIDEPHIPQEKAGKSLLHYLLIGLLIGIGAGAVGVYVYDRIDRRFVVPEDMQKFEELISFGNVYHNKEIPSYFPAHDSLAQLISQDNEIRETIFSIRKQLTKSGSKTIFVCSPVREEGKSLLSMLLATGLADRKLSVLLVDTDVYNPKVSQLYNKEYCRGFSDFVMGKCAFEKVVYPTDNEHLMLTPAGTNERLDDFRYEEDACASFVEKAYGVFDIILFDTPAALFIPEIANLLEVMDLAVVVVRLGLTTEASFERLTKRIALCERPSAGYIINGVRSSIISGRYNYYDYYGYQPKREKKMERPKIDELLKQNRRRRR